MSQTNSNDDTPPLPAGKPALTRDEIFHLLQCRRRRDALRYLRQHDGPVRMRDLAEQVAAWEHDTTVEALHSKQRQRVYIPLYQTHLPKLDDAGIIDYQQSRGVVERNPRADILDPYLDAASPDPTEEGADGDGSAADGGQVDGIDADGIGTHGTASTSVVDDSSGSATSGHAIGQRSAEPTGSTSASSATTLDWTGYYLGALAASAVGVAGVALGVPPLDGVPPLALGVAIPALFGAVSLAEHRHVVTARSARDGHQQFDERRPIP